MWYIISNGQQVGPMPKEDLAKYGLQPDSMVWTQGMPDWARACNVPELHEVLNAELDNRPPLGYPQPGGQAYNPHPQRGGVDPYGRYQPQTDKSKVAFGILAILLGSLGVQYFYVGKIGGGFICLLISCVTCFTIWPVITLIQGIVALCMSDEEFERKYVLSNNTFPLF